MAIFTGLLFLFLGGCASIDSTDDAPAQTRQVTMSSAETPPPPATPFPTDALYSLLAAELAGAREQYGVALRNYLYQAKKTKDPNVIRRTMQIARYVKSDSALLEAALLYYEIEPNNIEAMQMAALQLARANQFDASFELYVKIIAKQSATQLDFLASQIVAPKESPAARFLTAYQQLLNTEPKREDLLLGTAILLQAQNQSEQALVLVERVLADHPNDFQPNLLKSRILIAENRYPDALAHIQDAVENTPKDYRLRMQYIHILLINRRPEDKEYFRQNEALLREQFHQILLQNPRSPAAITSLSSTAAQAGLIDISELYLKQQIAVGYNAAQAYYYLGQFAESAGRLDEALIHYQQVDRGPLLAAITQRADILFRQGKNTEAQNLLKQTRSQYPEQQIQVYQIEIELLARHKQPDTALKLANRALQQSKDDPGLLYTRSMLYERTGDIKQAEADLRAIIEQQPDNSMALNALGYSLTVHTERYDEALELITRALAIDPEEAAIIDSLGWLQYRMGSLDEAQKNLERAHKKFKDPEVIAHLAEVLWVRGEKQRASELLHNGLKAQPDNPQLLMVIDKFKIPMPPEPPAPEATAN
ncbi:MAG: tetratricopeptide repeat protein [Pseudomonadales bacterium]|nr:tetratricopeptide repeat protein [Pseudomonadales bacterium]